ncbi:MAG TPA: ATPase, T2SS/T4P/T4SS family [Verrucomicrobiae bacterium]|jgi:twitching motility protein PilT|nr:ATPase, T2SS/T4P/T4SS family [Verrucomicrobiae bacterium]
MSLRALISLAKSEGASDLHLEPGLAAALRVRGSLRSVGEPLRGDVLLEAARDLIGADEWPQFLQRRSFDTSRTMEGVRCRINILHTSRGVGFAIRLLPGFQLSLEALNLHPSLKQMVQHQHGLVLISGPTGSGKSTTLAALIQTLNGGEARHIVTIENPIEYTFRPKTAFIRQREVGRDTPSFEQALLDSLREDPDVLMVGEMREPETMRLTLNAAETGHLVLATVHSANCAEALQRVVSAFPAEIQSSVAAQLADCLIGVVSQRLQFRPAVNQLIPECEVLTATHPIKNFIRNRDFFKIQSSIETGAEHGMWTYARYRGWLDKRTQFNTLAVEPEAEPDQERAVPLPAPAPPPETASVKPKAAAPGRIEIEPVEDFDRILKRPS